MIKKKKNDGDALTNSYISLYQLPLDVFTIYIYIHIYIQHIMMIRGHEGQTFEGCLPLFPGIES